MSEPLAPVPLLHVDGGDRRSRGRVMLAAAIVAALVAAALLKPWAAGPGSRSAAPRGGLAIVVPAPAGSPTGAAPVPDTPAPGPTAVGDLMPCLPTDGWRFVALESGRLGYIRSWSVIEPGATATPLLLRTEGLDALGFCPPSATGAGAHSAITAASWASDGGPGLVPVVALTLMPLVHPVGLDDPAWAVLYLAPAIDPAMALHVPAGRGLTGTWPSGDYEFRVTSPGGTDVTFTVDVLEVP